MPRYTTSYSTNKRPTPRRRASNQLPAGRRRAQRRPGATYLNHSHGFGRTANGRRRAPSSRDSSRRTYALIAVGCAFALFVASIIWYVNRSVTVTVNGDETSVRIGSTVEQLLADSELNLKAGNLLAVDDKVLTKGGGESAHVIVDGKHVKPSKFGTRELAGGEKVTVKDGEDVYEEHDVAATAIEPSLTVKGTGVVRYVETWGVSGRSEVWTGKVSGKTVDRGVVQNVQDCVVVARNVSPDGKGKYVALTFDEAPSDGTRQLLEILKQKDATATFFMSGEVAAAKADAVRAVAKAGCEVGVNAYTDTDLTKLDASDLRDQLSRAFDAVEAGGVKTALVRPPFNKFSDQNWCDAMDMVSTVVGWNVDSGDWTLPGADAVVSAVVDSVSSGDIVLLTDNASTWEQTVAALPGIIDGLTAKGYKLVTLSDLIATDEDLATAVGKVGVVEMPRDAALPKAAADAAGEDASATA